MSDLRFIDQLSLETECNVCEGGGRRWSEDQWRRCRRCDGAGYIPTEFGEKVLTLMRHNFKPMLQDATED